MDNVDIKNVMKLIMHALPKTAILLLLVIGIEFDEVGLRFGSFLIAGIISGIYHGVYNDLLWRSPKGEMHSEDKDIPYRIHQLGLHIFCGIIAAVAFLLLISKINLGYPLETTKNLNFADLIIFIIALTGYIGLLPRALWFWSYSGKLKD